MKGQGPGKAAVYYKFVLIRTEKGVSFMETRLLRDASEESTPVRG